MNELKTIRNLDYLAAKHAQSIIEKTKGRKSSDIENSITKTLGVLQENGVYACFLYLFAKEWKKENNQANLGEVVVREMLALLGEVGEGFKTPNISNPWKYNDNDIAPDSVLQHISDNITQHLERLLLAKDTLEQMLIYARYGAKARFDSQSTEA